MTRKNRYCTDQIVTLRICRQRIILEQSLEQNSSLYVNLVDYEKAFDSVDRECLWKLMRHFGMPEKITNNIQNSCEGLTCNVMQRSTHTHDSQLTDLYELA